MITASGVFIYPGSTNAPSPQDIAIGMCRITRYAGAIWCPLAAHSILVAEYAYDMAPDPELWAMALLHDAHETITGEIVRTFKGEQMRLIEDRLDQIIFKSFNLSYESYNAARPLIKRADEFALAAETTILELPYFEEFYLQMEGRYLPALPKGYLYKAWRILRDWSDTKMISDRSLKCNRLRAALVAIQKGCLSEAMGFLRGDDD